MNDALKKLGIVFDEDDKSYIVRKNGIASCYDDLTEAVWGGVFGFCSCGEPKTQLIKIYNLLAAMDEETLKEPAEEDLIYLYLLDSEGMTEHGCSVRFSWLNDKGRALMKVIKSTCRTK